MTSRDLHIFRKSTEIRNSKRTYHRYFDVMMLCFTKCRNVQSFKLVQSLILHITQVLGGVYMEEGSLLGLG